MCTDVHVSPAARGIAGRISSIVLSLGLCSERQLQTDWLRQIRCSKSLPFIWSMAIGILSPFLILTFGKGEQVHHFNVLPSVSDINLRHKKEKWTDWQSYVDRDRGERRGGGEASLWIKTFKINVSVSNRFFPKALVCHSVICVLNIEDVHAASYFAPDWALCNVIALMKGGFTGGLIKYTKTHRDHSDLLYFVS